MAADAGARPHFQRPGRRARTHGTGGNRQLVRAGARGAATDALLVRRGDHGVVQSAG